MEEKIRELEGIFRELVTEQKCRFNVMDIDADTIQLTVTNPDLEPDMERGCVLYQCDFGKEDIDKTTGELLIKLLTTPVIIKPQGDLYCVSVPMIWQTKNGRFQVIHQEILVDKETLGAERWATC